MTRHPPSAGAVRVTLHPGEDVLLRPGARLADVRAPLAALVRRPELRYATFAVDGVPLADDQVIGERPLVPGAVLRVRAPGHTEPPARPGTAHTGPWLAVRVTGPDAGTVAVVAGLWAALRTWARMRPNGRVVIRRTRGAADWLAPRPQPVPGGAPWALTLLPAVASLGLAATLRQPVLAVFALVGLAVVVPQLRAARRRSGGGATRNRTCELPGPARLLTFAHALLHVSPGAWAAARQAHAVARSSGPPGGLPGYRDLLPFGPNGPWEQVLHDDTVAVTGPEDLAGSVARALLVGLAVRGATVRVEVRAGRRSPGWSWTRWLPGGGPLIVVTDGATDHAPLGGSGTSDPISGATLVVSVGAIPAGCRAVVRVLDIRRVRITGPDGTAHLVPLAGVTAEWAEHLARLLSGAAWLGRTASALHGPGDQDVGGEDTHGAGSASAGVGATQRYPEDTPDDLRLPALVPLTRAHGLTELPGPETVTARWADARGWAVPLGTGPDGSAVCFDLVRDGPHLLVAGTTGSGKSELLQTFVLGLALTRSPADLALVLVDFKGGASFGACPGLPHVVGTVTDLEPGLAARALAGLRAELRRREHVLAEAGVPDIAALPATTLPRLVVVIDEFRALADDLPEFLPALLRVAAQGRSLGVHLVLATQRPGGVVGPDLRANVSARIALRVTDLLESRDVIDDPSAARIPVTAPGRAVLRTGSARPVPLQCAHATAVPEPETPLARRAPGLALPFEPPVARGTAGPGPTAGPDPAVLVVEAARHAARALGHPPGAPPWLPPLPRRATTTDLPPATRRDRVGLALALGDDPDRQRRTTVAWHPDDGHLAILGRARSGRTTTLVTIALAALRQGWTVRGITRDPAAFAPLREHPGYGGTLHPDDAARSASMLLAVARTLVLVDGAEDVRGTLAPAVLRSGAAFALTADGPAMGGLASRVGPRLVLLGTDRATDIVLGAPTLLAGSGGPPGRAAWCGKGDPVLCQVLEPYWNPVSVLRARRRRRRDHGGRQEQRHDEHRDDERCPATRDRDSAAAADRGNGSDDLEELPGHHRPSTAASARQKRSARDHEDPGHAEKKEHQKEAHAHRHGTAHEELDEQDHGERGQPGRLDRDTDDEGTKKRRDATSEKGFQYWHDELGYWGDRYSQ